MIMEPGVVVRVGVCLSAFPYSQLIIHSTCFLKPYLWLCVHWFSPLRAFASLITLRTYVLARICSSADEISSECSHYASFLNIWIEFRMRSSNSLNWPIVNGSLILKQIRLKVMLTYRGLFLHLCENSFKLQTSGQISIFMTRNLLHNT